MKVAVEGSGSIPLPLSPLPDPAVTVCVRQGKSFGRALDDPAEDQARAENPSGATVKDLG